MRLHLSLAILVVACLASSCDWNGTFYLYNSIPETIILRTTQHEYYSPTEYVIKAGGMGELYLYPAVDNEVSAELGTRQWCYQIKEVPFKWVAPSFPGPKVYVKLTSDGTLYLYPQESQRDSFYKAPPPPQPPGYPLQPTECTQTPTP